MNRLHDDQEVAVVNAVFCFLFPVWRCVWRLGQSQEIFFIFFYLGMDGVIFLCWVTEGGWGGGGNWRMIKASSLRCWSPCWWIKAKGPLLWCSTGCKGSKGGRFGNVAASTTWDRSQYLTLWNKKELMCRQTCNKAQTNLSWGVFIYICWVLARLLQFEHEKRSPLVERKGGGVWNDSIGH